jgi:transcriptional regulator with XRE-family HTH domain
VSTARSSSGFPDRLKAWRTRRRLSQLELALTCSVSQRHLSFLESGRSRPSRQMILQLSEALDVPLRDRNDWLLAAGFAPVFAEHALDDPRLRQVMQAVEHMLAAHAPYPAVAIDRTWTVRLANPPFERMLSLLGMSATPDRPANLLRILFAPDGIKRYVSNWNAIAPMLWQRALRESQALGGEEVQQLLKELAPGQEALTLGVDEEMALIPVLPLRLEIDGLALAFISVISTFGTAQDITTGELRMETFFPADTATQQFFESLREA